VNKELRKLIKRLEKGGCTVAQGGKHLKVKNPEGKTVYTLPTTPSTQNWKIRAETQLKKMGLL
jgi:predicted RNA binding protein YcfA (HicA-like mRNA interferase family)